MQAACLAFSVALLAGCAQENKKKQAEDRAALLEQANRQYIGKHKDVLIKDKGSPIQTMDATVMGRPPSEAYVYPVNEVGCYDSFVVLEDSGMILDYFCR